MPHQDGFGDNGPEATGLSKPDDGDDCMQKKSENVAHAKDGIRLKSLRIQGTCGIRHPQDAAGGGGGGSGIGSAAARKLSADQVAESG